MTCSMVAPATQVVLTLAISFRDKSNSRMGLSKAVRDNVRRRRTLSRTAFDKPIRLFDLSRKLMASVNTTCVAGATIEQVMFHPSAYADGTDCMSINPILSEWLNFIARWVHVFAGIMWVGTTYYFTWLDARLTEEEKAMANVGKSAQIWMVHS